MFTLRIHTVDDLQPLFATSSNSAGRCPNRSKDSCSIIELRGIPHLFRQLPSPSSTTPVASFSLSNPNARSTCLFIVAVPNYLSLDEFLQFCGSYLENFSELLFLRNDGMEDRYSVLIRLVNQLTADGFYCNFNGKRFKPSEAEVCHMYFTQSVEYTESGEIAGEPGPDFTELPTCLVCLERLDQDTSGIQSTLCDHSFHCSCVSKWTNLSCQVCRLIHQQDERAICAVCRTLKNLWVCLICGFVGCGRYEEQHAIKHWCDTQHRFFLELETQQIWDYVGDKYVHRLNQSKLDGMSGMPNSRCMPLDEESGTCVYDEESGMGDALFSSKVEGIVDEYNRLLATQLEIQRQHYESLLATAKSEKENSISKAVEKAVSSSMQDLQNRVEDCMEKKKTVADTNEVLTKNNEVLQKMFEEIVERQVSVLKPMESKILDLEEQIRDMKIFVKAQRTLANRPDSNDIKGGTVLPVQSAQSSPHNSKRRMRPGRRRN